MLRKISRNKWFWIIAIANLILDQLTKYIIVSNFEWGTSLPLIQGVFHFTYITNDGAAFSIFKGQFWLKWLSLIFSVSLISYVSFTRGKINRWQQIALGFILAGAIGNGIDRFMLGHVIDFIDLRIINFAIFNWADVSINIGVFSYLILSILEDRKTPSKTNRKP
jgi:signal peptidase II